jgi:hypothetical protein
MTVPGNLRADQDSAGENLRSRRIGASAPTETERKGEKGKTHKVRPEYRQDHRRKLPLPVRITVALQREQERCQSRPDAAEYDEELGGDSGGGDGDDGLFERGEG